MELRFIFWLLKRKLHKHNEENISPEGISRAYRKAYIEAIEHPHNTDYMNLVVGAAMTLMIFGTLLVIGLNIMESITIASP